MIKSLKALMILSSAAAICVFPGHGAETSPRFEQPILITSAGQSADVQIAGVLAKRAGLTAVLTKDAAPQDLDGKKSLALVFGVSMKGLGAAGLDLDQETARVEEIVEEARKKGIPLLCLHLGGEARRGELSDRMIKTFLPYAQTVIVVKSGNKDGLFTQICSENDIPLFEADKTGDVQGPLKDLFSQNG